MKEVLICSCGRIHFYDSNILIESAKAGRSVMFICDGCGQAILMGADERCDLPFNGKPSYEAYSFPCREDQYGIIDGGTFDGGSDGEKLLRIIRSRGVRVMMKTGYFAKSYHNGKFEDIWYPDFLYDYDFNRLPKDRIVEMIEKWKRDSTTVNMRSLLESLTDEEAEALSHRIIEGLNWTGTKYERK